MPHKFGKCRIFTMQSRITKLKDLSSRSVCAERLQNTRPLVIYHCVATRLRSHALSNFKMHHRVAACRKIFWDHFKAWLASTKLCICQQYKLCCSCKIVATVVLAQVAKCIASSSLNSGSKLHPYRFLFLFFSSIWSISPFLTLGIFSPIIESKHGALSLLKIDLCYKFDFNLWQPDCHIIYRLFYIELGNKALKRSQKIFLLVA